MKVINLTPHAIRVFNDGELTADFPPSGTVARIGTERQKVGMMGAIAIYRTEYGPVENMSRPQDGVVYIVSALVRLAMPERADLMSPGLLIRNADGQPIGCEGLDA